MAEISTRQQSADRRTDRRTAFQLYIVDSTIQVIADFETIFLNSTNITDSVYRGWAGGRGMGWALRVGG